MRGLCQSVKRLEQSPRGNQRGTAQDNAVDAKLREVSGGAFGAYKRNLCLNAEPFGRFV